MFIEATNSHSARPAVLGGAPAFPGGLPLARPRVAQPAVVAEQLLGILESGILTNGSYVRELERISAKYLAVRHCIAVASCTAGLMLVLRAKDLSGDVIVPSFTFAATAHAVAWNDLRPVFADVDERSLTLSPDSVRRTMGIRTSAIMATHTFGTPCHVEELKQIADEHGIPLLFDAAHAFGSLYRGRHVGGLGHAEVFSLSPTKVLVAGEGGIIATNDDFLAERCRIGRDYGNPGDYDCRFVGLNARMSEVHAATAIASFQDLEERLAARIALARWYAAAFEDVPGITMAEVHPQDRSTYKDLTIVVDPEEFGVDAPTLATALADEGIDTRRYYWPPVHEQTAYRSLASGNGALPVTERVSPRVLSLPLWVGMTEDDVALVAWAVERIGRGLGRARAGRGPGRGNG